jgi:hypothetical protein
VLLSTVLPADELPVVWPLTPMTNAVLPPSISTSCTTRSNDGIVAWITKPAPAHTQSNSTTKLMSERELVESSCHSTGTHDGMVLKSKLTSFFAVQQNVIEQVKPPYARAG